jgi:glycine reductase
MKLINSRLIAWPGESKRIVPIKDVIEPRVKVNGSGEIFPGFFEKAETVGYGITHVLEGVAIVTSGRIVNFQKD